MTVEELAFQYIEKTESVFDELKTIQACARPDAGSVRGVVEEARRYLHDAKHYLDSRRFETSLASIAYCEGLLDALRMLGLVEFSW